MGIGRNIPKAAKKRIKKILFGGRVCRKCGKVNREEASHCRRCGYSKPEYATTKWYRRRNDEARG